MFSRLQNRRIGKAVAYVEGTLARCADNDLTPVRVFEVVKSERKGSKAIVIAQDGRTFTAWLWWYQTKVGELIICEPPTSDAQPAGHPDAVSIGNVEVRGVVDRIPRDVMDLYVASTSAAEG
ncbi:MAG: hypothetical protein AB8G14_18170 [Ilumatobacter sp.]